MRLWWWHPVTRRLVSVVVVLGRSALRHSQRGCHVALRFRAGDHRRHSPGVHLVVHRVAVWDATRRRVGPCAGVAIRKLRQRRCDACRAQRVQVLATLESKAPPCRGQTHRRECLATGERGTRHTPRVGARLCPPSAGAWRACHAVDAPRLCICSPSSSGAACCRRCRNRSPSSGAPPGEQGRHTPSAAVLRVAQQRSRRCASQSRACGVFPHLIVAAAAAAGVRDDVVHRGCLVCQCPPGRSLCHTRTCAGRVRMRRPQKPVPRGVCVVRQRRVRR